MMAADLIRITDYIESRWGSTSKAWLNTEAMVEEFRPFTAGAILETLHEMFREGHDFTPKPSMVRRRVGTVQRRRWERGDDLEPSRVCGGAHVWAVVHYPGASLVPDDCDELVEHQWCALCHEERFVRRAAA